MDYSKPIYSVVAQCQDCYRCVRECPVKAIKVTGNQASIVPELCIACGHCVRVCPSGAKIVRDDLRMVKRLLAERERVIVSLAPSFVSEFGSVSAGKLISALKTLGFYGVSETALGAQQVSAQLGLDLERQDGANRLYISSACPVAVEFVTKYQPEHADAITGILSPLLAHCRLLKERYGDDISVVFIGPCIAKKLEARTHPELLDAVLTFEDLRKWLDGEGIALDDIQPGDDDVFVPEAAAEGTIYPIEGGMVEATKVNCEKTDVQFMCISGIGRIEKALADIVPSEMPHSVFLELLACEGGCVHGPKARDRSTIVSRLSVLENVEYREGVYPRKPSVKITDVFHIDPVHQTVYTLDEMQEALLHIGKQSIEDELNCGGCGYHSCRELAAAILSGKAENNMCVSHMRELAQKKANAILRTLPCAAVLVDQNLSIIECNDEFIHLGGDDALVASKVLGGLEGAKLHSIVPFTDLFMNVLDSGEDTIRKFVRFGDTVLSTTIFSVEAHRVVGAIMIDVTSVEIRREQIVEKAQQVIQNTLSSVQDIAFRLGKSAAESELILNSIVDAYSVTHYDADEDKTQ